MLLEFVYGILFNLAESVIYFLPTALTLPAWIIDSVLLIRKGLSFFPDGIFQVVMDNIIFWLTGLTGWGIIEWCYKKIPGVS